MSKATKIMNQRNEYKCELVNELNTLGYQVSTLDELIPTTTVTKEETTASIIINKGHIVEVQTVIDNTDYETIEELKMQLDIAKEEINYYHDVEKDYNNDIELFQKDIARHLRRINELTADNEKLLDETMTLENEIAFKDGQILGLNNQIKQLEDKVAELQSALKAKKLTKVKSMQEELKEYKQELEKGDDKPVSKLDVLKKIKRAPEFTLESALKDQEAKLAKQEEEKQAAKAKLPKYELKYETTTFDETIDSKTMFGIHGTITIEGQEHAFEATNNHHMPIVYGCMDEEFLNTTKEIIMHEVQKFTFMNEEEVGAANYSHMHDAEHALVVWRLTDDKGNINYHAYTDKYVLVWDNKKFKVPARKMLKYALDKDPKHYRKLEQQKNTKKLSDKFMAICQDIWPEDFSNDDNDPEPTKAVIKRTIEKSSDNQPITYQGTIDDFTPITNEGNNELDCDDIDL